MQLTPRDLEIFKLMAKTAILTTAQIQKSTFSGVAATTVLRRLRKLETEKYIQRVDGLPNHEVAWALTLKGSNIIGYANPKRHFHRLSLVHDVKLSDLRLKLEDCGVAHSWIPEHEIRSAMARKHGVRRMQSATVPDGIMGVSHKGVMESVAIELELHHKSQNRYKHIFQSYRWKENILAVWYLVPSKSLGKHLERLWLGVSGRPVPWFLWSEVDDVIQNGERSKIFYFDKTFELENLFKPKKLIVVPAHKDGFGVSTQYEEMSETKINLTPQDQKEKVDQAG